MVSVVKSGTATRYAIQPGVGSHPLTAHAVHVMATIAGATVFESSIPFADAVANGIVVPASATTITSRRAFAMITYEFQDEQGNLIAMVAEELIIESENLLAPGENSFAGYQELMLDSFDMTDLSAFREATKDEQVAALITAYYNIGSMRVSLFQHRDLSDPTLFDRDVLIGVTSTRTLRADVLAALKPSVQLQLRRSQLAEANSILGGNPIERARGLGLLSHSAGESTHFYRTTKPLELPISKRAAVELRGILNYALRISR